MSNRSLINQFQQWQQAGESMALATVIHTEGSTYSKAGRHVLITADGKHEGLLSGGCLEGDLAEQARTVLANGDPRIIDYDMRDAADDLWGIGLGCNGMMQILLQRLDAETDWQPFTTIAGAMARDSRSTAALVVRNATDVTHSGACFVADTTGSWRGATAPPAFLSAPATLPTIVPHATDTGACDVLYWRINPWPRLLLLGAGPDAVPVVSLAKSLGWEITLADHRPHYIESGAFADADYLRLINPARLAEQLPLTRYTAVVVMSHHLDTDRTYLQRLANLQHPYAGILGPPARKAKLLDELELGGSEFEQRLYGPVGLDIGADSPETIALSLLSQIQAVISRSAE